MATSPKLPKVLKKPSYTYAVGRRKTANARVRIYKTKSVPGMDGVQLSINGKSAEAYFPSETAKAAYRKPFILTETLSKISASVVVAGSGKMGQLDAVVHGLARALSLLDRDAYRTILKSAGLLTRDARTRQRRMIGTGGKARRTKQSPKR
ncbi:30S ribosomal protein S9 [Candidatus Collierbacteria bacterium CG10_big_fil_rev_8_21_14_0_10_44_9]|uniref:Small ribosomal subunit protein uS9 n=1 Tax=Candidatus Collierbacteria bacterium CG10_big_fil_rev_8_21_14_0_10_44_9 TaxID=1974535 RepID=A0A2H0VJM6_9BACT|nr:MAG: 30S ribosomal protein S9 [Candidatus Collierbacteria bacterium CG10_big_fil_rev_8_21_14_0_10_44_9]